MVWFIFLQCWFVWDFCSLFPVAGQNRTLFQEFHWKCFYNTISWPCRGTQAASALLFQHSALLINLCEMYRMQSDHLPLAFYVSLPFQGKTKPGPCLIPWARALICHRDCSPSISGISLKPPPIYNLSFPAVSVNAVLCQRLMDFYIWRVGQQQVLVQACLNTSAGCLRGPQQCLRGVGWLCVGSACTELMSVWFGL